MIAVLHELAKVVNFSRYEEILVLDGQVNHVQAQIQLELDDWKHKYFDQVQLTNELKLEVLTLSEDLAEYKKRTDTFSAVKEK